MIGEGLSGEIDQIVWYSRAFSPAELEMGAVDFPDDALGIWRFETRSETITNDAMVNTPNHGIFRNADLTPPQIEA